MRWIVGNVGNVAGMLRMWRGGPGGNRGGDCVEARSVGHFLKCVLWEVELGDVFADVFMDHKFQGTPTQGKSGKMNCGLTMITSVIS